jgi:O-acetyl-ADP-ribose deacetylase (regulator of RNase III)
MSYVRLNIKSLKEEFPGLDGEIVESTYFSSGKDCERARRALREMAGQPIISTNEERTERGEFVLEELQGDLFTCDPAASLCHCVSEDMAMGKGIAVQFKKRFGKVAELKAQQSRTGSAAVLEKPDCPGAFVYYLVTKARYFHKPTLASVRQSCEWMRDHAVLHNVGCIALPRIACGLDGLQWLEVKDMLIDVFSLTSVKLQVYSF